MPQYEYKCVKCGHINLFTEDILEKEAKDFFRSTFPFKFFFRRKCSKCGGIYLRRVYSSFMPKKTQTTREFIDELKRYGPVNIVQDHRRPGPPPGGCPFADKPEKPGTGDKKGGGKR